MQTTSIQNLTQNQEYARLTLVAIHKFSPQTTGDFQTADAPLATKDIYLLLRQFFEDIAEQQKIALHSQFARWSFVCFRHQVSPNLQRHLFEFRKRMTRFLYEDAAFTADMYPLALFTAAHTVAEICGVDLPENLQNALPEPNFYQFADILATAHYPKIRVVVLKDDLENQQLICRSEDFPSKQPLRACYNVTGRNEHFDETVKQIRRRLRYDFAVTLLLHEVDIDDKMQLYPSFFVLEPDYLLEVTAVAECFHSQHEPPVVWSHLLKKFLKIPRSPALMIGNIANFFLDELMYKNASIDIDTIRFEDIFKQVFRLNPLGFCLMSDDDVREIASKCRIHFDSIKTMVKTGFSESGIMVENCYLEPSFYSADYGIFGRLDIFYKNPKGIDGSAIVELKSGKPYNENSYGVSVNHYTQTLLYDLMLKSVYGAENEVAKYILYSGLYDANRLRFAPATFQAQSEALQVRNRLAATDFSLCELTDEHALRDGTIIDTLRYRSNTVKGFLNTDLQGFLNVFTKLNTLERAYFIGFVGFIAREQRLSKIGTDNDRINGMASLWRNPLEEKQNSFAILYKLQITDSKAEENDPIIELKATETDFESSFRVGDIGVLYAAPDSASLPIHTQIFKCTILEITNNKVIIRLRAKQSNPADFLIKGMFWNIEPDTMDGGFMLLYRNLFAFVESSTYSKNLLLGLQAPQKSNEIGEKNDKNEELDWIINDKNLTDEQKNVLVKAIESKDYFLLWGPPGTGKTSQMLRYYIHHFLYYSNEKMLLLAFTNRAVEEITTALHEVVAFGKYNLDEIKANYLRIGTRVGASKEFEGQFLDDKIANVSTRQQLREVIDSHRIIVSTVAGIMGKDELFELGKTGVIRGFDRVIIDEASQLTEPMLCGLLPKFKHFMLIGDHRQLPAVVTQSSQESATKTDVLHEIGLYNLRNSLFERLYLLAQKNGWTWAYNKLSLQGRMHTDINEFAKRFFYDNNLDVLANWQKQALSLNASFSKKIKKTNDFKFILPFLDKLLSKRMVFIPANTENNLSNNKTNKNEAEIIKELVDFFKLCYKNEEKPVSLGVITPFRAQITMIKSYLAPENSEVLIDTVERYQGGARDIILISFCANSPQQLAQMTSIHEENGMRIDRKLNVALTRARKHLIVVGNRNILNADETYAALLNFIEENYL